MGLYLPLKAQTILYWLLPGGVGKRSLVPSTSGILSYKRSVVKEKRDIPTAVANLPSHGHPDTPNSRIQIMDRGRVS